MDDLNSMALSVRIHLLNDELKLSFDFYNKGFENIDDFITITKKKDPRHSREIINHNKIVMKTRTTWDTTRSPYINM